VVSTVNWTLLITISLILANPVNLGIANSTSNGTLTTQLDELLVQAGQQEIQAAFTATPTTGTAPLTVQFDASTSIGDNLSYEWDFGDGTTGVGEQVEHIYQYAGVFFPVLKILKGVVSDYASTPIKSMSADTNNTPPENLRTATSPEGREQYRLWWLNHILSERGLSKLLYYVNPNKIGGVEAFTPDRQWVVYQGLDFDNTYGRPGITTTHQFYLVNLQTGESSNLSQISNVLIEEISMAQDASMFAYQESDKLEIYIADRSNLLYTIDFVGNTVNGDNRKPVILVGGYTFSPDNQKLGMYIQYELSFDDGYIPRPNEKTESGLVLIEVPLGQSTTINLETIESYSGFIKDISFESIGGVENFGGLYWEGDSLKWFDERLLLNR